MDALIPFESINLDGYHFGDPQQSGAMTVLPILGRDEPERFTPPGSGLKLIGVHGYGNIEMKNNLESICIIPLHIGYIQDRAQNHALCRSAFIGADQKIMVKDACCVQAGQGGFLKEAEQWFFILPLQLREEALRLRGKEQYSKLWPAITNLNRLFGYEDRGHLEEIISRQKPYLNQFQNRFELIPGQTGAIFFLRGKMAGIEIAPDSAYFADVWKALVCFCYGTASMFEEKISGKTETIKPPIAGGDIKEIRKNLIEERAALKQTLIEIIGKTPAEQLKSTEEERYIDLRLNTVESDNYTGQVVMDAKTLIYASIFIRNQYYQS